MNIIMTLVVMSLFVYLPSTEVSPGKYGLRPWLRIDKHSPNISIAKTQRKGDLEFVETEAYKSKDGKNFFVKGTVRNIGKISTKKVTVTVIIYDKDNNELEKKTVPLNPDLLRPGDEGSFEIKTAFHKQMHGYQKTIKWNTTIRD